MGGFTLNARDWWYPIALAFGNLSYEMYRSFSLSEPCRPVSTLLAAFEVTFSPTLGERTPDRGPLMDKALKDPVTSAECQLTSYKNLTGLLLCRYRLDISSYAGSGSC